MRHATTTVMPSQIKIEHSIMISLIIFMIELTKKVQINKTMNIMIMKFMSEILPFVILINSVSIYKGKQKEISMIYLLLDKKI